MKVTIYYRKEGDAAHKTLQIEVDVDVVTVIATIRELCLKEFVIVNISEAHFQ